jgi:hypothetical protein
VRAASAGSADPPGTEDVCSPIGSLSVHDMAPDDTACRLTAGASKAGSQ